MRLTRLAVGFLVVAACSRRATPPGAVRDLALAHAPPADMAAPLRYCDGTSAADPRPCSFPSGLVASGAFVGVVPSYDNCPAVVRTVPSNLPPVTTDLATLDASSKWHVVATNPTQTFAGPTQLFVWGSVGALTFWDRTHGAVVLSQASQDWGYAADDSHAAFFTDAVPVGSLTLASAPLDCSGLNGVKRLDTNAFITADITGGKIVASSYAQGAGTWTVRAYDPASGAGLLLAESPFTVAHVSSVGTVLLHDDHAMPSVVSVAGGSPVAIGGGHAFDEGMFTHDGSAVVYRSGAAIVRAPVDGGAATVLVPSSAVALLALSPDDNWMVYATTSMGGAHSSPVYVDAWLTSARMAQQPFSLNTTGTVSKYSVLFTNDGRWIVWLDGGMLHAHPTGNGIERVLGAAQNLTLAAGARVVWDNDDNASPASVFAVDLAAAGGMPQTIATLPPGYPPMTGKKWVLSGDSSTVFYVQSGTSAGLYATRLQ